MGIGLLDSKLIDAFKADDLELVALLMKEGANFEVIRDEFDAGLTDAVRSGDDDKIANMLAIGTKTVYFEEKGKVDSVLAAYYGHLECLKYALEQTDSFQTFDLFRRTELYMAASNGHFECVKYLVERGADVNAIDTTGNSVLFGAVDYGDVEIVKFLVENGADVNFKSRLKAGYSTKNGNTLLHQAALSAKLDCFLFLMDKGLDLNSENDFGRKATDLMSDQWSSAIDDHLLGKTIQATSHQQALAF